MVNGIECPTPLTKVEEGRVYALDAACPRGYVQYKAPSTTATFLIERWFAYRSKDDVLATAKALGWKVV